MVNICRNFGLLSHNFQVKRKLPCLWHVSWSRYCVGRFPMNSVAIVNSDFLRLGMTIESTKPGRSRSSWSGERSPVTRMLRCSRNPSPRSTFRAIKISYWGEFIHSIDLFITNFTCWLFRCCLKANGLEQHQEEHRKWSDANHCWVPSWHDSDVPQLDPLQPVDWRRLPYGQGNVSRNQCHHTGNNNSSFRLIYVNYQSPEVHVFVLTYGMTGFNIIFSCLLAFLMPYFDY